MPRNRHTSPPYLLFMGMGMLALFFLGGSLAWQTTVSQAAETPQNIALPQQDDPTPAPTIEPFIQSDLTILSGNVQRPNGLVWHDGFIYTACSGDFTIYRLHDTTGETITYIAGVQNSHDMVVDRDETGKIQVWVADYQRNTFLKVNEGPTMDILAEGLASPWGLDMAEDDSFYMTLFRSDEIIHMQRDGSFTVAASGLRGPTGVAVDGDYVYVANNGSARRAVEWFDRTTGATITQEALRPLVQGLQNPTNLTMGPDGRLYIAYSLGTRGIVGRIDPALCRDKGGCTNADVEIVLWSEIAAPLAGLTLSDDMRLYVHTMFGPEIYWVQLPQESLLQDDEGGVQVISTTTPAPAN